MRPVDMPLRAPYNAYMLPKTSRLKADRDFKTIFDAGRWGGGAFISLKYAKNEDGDSAKMGFMVGTKVAKSAVKRNLVKRRMREVVRLMVKSGKIMDNFDVIFIAKPETAGKTYHEIEEDIKIALNRAKIIK